MHTTAEIPISEICGDKITAYKGASAVIKTTTLATDASEYYAVFPADCAYKEVNYSGLNTFIKEDGSIQISTGTTNRDKSQTFKSYAIASKAGGHFMFKNVDAIVYFKTERTDIASVEFKSNISGMTKSTVLINPSTEEITRSSYCEARSVEYKLNGDKEAYIPVSAGVTFVGGYTLTAYDSSNNVLGTISTSTDLSFENGKYYTIKDFDSRLQTPLPDGALPGKFTINSDGDQIYFSKGNLYAKYEDSKWSWNFYNEQYCYNSYNISCSKDGNRLVSGDEKEIDQFTWGYNAEKSIIPDGDAIDNVSRTSGDLTQTEDWGCKIGDGNTWRTLTIAEWQYLFNMDDTYGSNIRSGKYKYGVTVCDKTNCVVIAPDNWDLISKPLQDEYSSESSPMTLAQAEAAGLVILPAAGGRYGSNVYSVNVGGLYWSSSALDDDAAYRLFFDSNRFRLESLVTRGFANSIRLVTDVTE